MKKTAFLFKVLFLSLTFLGVASAHPDSKDKTVQENLKEFDELDFEIFSNQDWEGFKKNHSDDIVVYWPDGHSTKGLKKHLEDMKAMFAHAPDTRIKSHPIKIGSGEWTAVTGVFEATFTKPLKLPDGTVIQPTGKKLKMPMATIARWKNGVMTEEHLFWDNETYNKQLGITDQIQKISRK